MAGDAQCAATLDAEADQGRHTALLQTVATQRILGPDQPSTSQMLSTTIINDIWLSSGESISGWFIDR